MDSLKYDIINGVLLVQITTYIVYHVNTNINVEKAIVCPSTAVSYMSTLKHVIANKFSYRLQSIVFGQDYWQRHMD